MEMPKELNPEPGEAIAVAVTIQSQVNPRRTIVMQTYIARDLPVRDFHHLVDKLSAVTDRQEARFDLQGVVLSLEADKKGLAAAQEAFANIERLNAAVWAKRGKKGDPVLSQTEEQAKINHGTNIRHFNKEIAKKEKEIKELEGKLAKVD